MRARTVILSVGEDIDKVSVFNLEVAGQPEYFANDILVHNCDEVAFWPTDEAGANPDVEILKALRPRMTTIPGAMLIAISSPYARRGALWEAYRRHYGEDGDPVLVWQADTRTMNPNVDPQLIADAYEQDEAAAAAEYGAEFRRDIESFVSREAVEACVVPGRRELPAVDGIRYMAFVDPSGGSQDSMTLAIAHRESDGHVVLDCVRERRPPFSPADVVAEFAATLESYSISSVTGDRYGGEWPRERFREHGISYSAADHPKSDLYRELLPLLNSGRVELLDLPKLINQICSLERRTARSGKDSIDHPPGGHEDVANAAAGVLVSYRQPSWQLLQYDEPQETPTRGHVLRDQLNEQLRAVIPGIFDEPAGPVEPARTYKSATVGRGVRRDDYTSSRRTRDATGGSLGVTSTAPS